MMHHAPARKLGCVWSVKHTLQPAAMLQRCCSLPPPAPLTATPWCTCRQEVVRQLHNSLDNLQKQGGQDPLHQSLVDANEAAQQAGPAAAAGPRVGRARHWEDSPVAVSGGSAGGPNWDGLLCWCVLVCVQSSRKRLGALLCGWSRTTLLAEC